MTITQIGGFGRIGVQFTGLDKLQAAITRLEQGNRVVEKVMGIIGNFMRRCIVYNFKREEQMDGTPWPPLSPLTLALRGKQGKKLQNMGLDVLFSPQELMDQLVPAEDVEMLVDTGRMRNSISYTVEGNSVYAGTNDEKAKTHQFGGTSEFHGKTYQVPMRQFIYIRDDDEMTMIKMLTDELIINALKAN